jgi:exodeoxyribonuclease VII small subunit
MKESKSFEASLKKLEVITKKLENEEIPLEEALALFEEGVKLVKELHQKLSEAERRVEILIKESEEKFHLEPFEESFDEGE